MMLQPKTIRLRLISENDTEFILGLRLNSKYNKFTGYAAHGGA